MRSFRMQNFSNINRILTFLLQELGTVVEHQTTTNDASALIHITVICSPKMHCFYHLSTL